MARTAIGTAALLVADLPALLAVAGVAHARATDGRLLGAGGPDELHGLVGEDPLRGPQGENVLIGAIP